MSSPSSEQDSPVPKVTSEEPVCLSPFQVSRPANKHHGRTYRRKKAKSKSKLKVLPMSSPSSELDSPVPKVNQAELLFDQIFHSSPTHSSGLPEGAELQTSQVQKDMFGGDLSFIAKEGFGSGRKRSALDSGYLSDQTEGPLGKTRKEEPEAKGEGPVSEGVEGEYMWEEPGWEGPEGEEPEGEEGEEPLSEGESPEWEEPEPEGEEPEDPNRLQTESSPEGARPVGGAEPGSHLTSDITAAFNTFNSQLEHHFTGCWKNVETEILQSLTKCQQHVSSLLTAGHQHRFQSSVTDQLKSLLDDSNRLASINTQTLNFFHTEMQQLGSFCEEAQTTLRSWGGGESGAGHPSSQ